MKDTRGCILYDSVCVTFWKAKTVGTEGRSVVTRNWGRRKGFEDRSMKELCEGSEIVYILVVETVIQLYIFFRTQN